VVPHRHCTAIEHTENMSTSLLHLAILLGSLCGSTLAASPLVALDYATYQGYTTSNGVSNFLGMRYAAAPTGNNRFRAPQDPAVVSGVQQATQVLL